MALFTGVVLAAVLAYVYCACPEGWSQYKNSCYRDFGETNNWKFARNDCKYWGGYLADITSQDENDFIEKLAFGEEGYWFWIGVRHKEVGDGYVYESSKKEITYAIWHEKETISKQRPYCVRMGYDGLWEHYLCDSKQFFICESDIFIHPKFFRYVDISKGFRFNGHYYRAVGYRVSTYDEAKKACEENDAYLVEIDSYEENKFIYEKITSFVFAGNIVKYGQTPRYIGARDIEVEGDFKWLDGTLLTYENWWYGEPNNDDGEDCMVMRYWGKWKDVDCSQYNRYVCEISLNKNPCDESEEKVQEELLTTTEPYPEENLYDDDDHRLVTANWFA